MEYVSCEFKYIDKMQQWMMAQAGEGYELDLVNTYFCNKRGETVHLVVMSRLVEEE